MIKHMLMFSRTLPGECSQQSLQPLVRDALKLLRTSIHSSANIEVQLPETFLI